MAVGPGTLVIGAHGPFFQDRDVHWEATGIPLHAVSASDTSFQALVFRMEGSLIARARTCEMLALFENSTAQHSSQTSGKLHRSGSVVWVRLTASNVSASESSRSRACFSAQGFQPLCRASPHLACAMCHQTSGATFVASSSYLRSRKNAQLGVVVLGWGISSVGPFPRRFCTTCQFGGRGSVSQRRTCSGRHSTAQSFSARMYHCADITRSAAPLKCANMTR
eukprot:2956414-Amphidinium_carterae.3